jgi:predicted DNA-binding transcriptional regulator AlpA
MGDTAPDKAVAGSRPTLAEISATWPAGVSVPKACTALGISRSHGYELAHRNQFPCRVIRAGSRRVVVTADLIRVLSAREEPRSAAA